MQVYERDAYSMLTRFIDPGSGVVFVDAGANVGETCARFKHEFPHSTVLAFEPSPRVFPTLRERSEAMPGVVPIEACLGRREGTAELRLTSNDWCASTLSPSAEGRRLYPSYMEDAGIARVWQTTIDAWAARQNIPRIDAIKLDVQGAELAVLEGAERTLAERGVLAVYSEAQISELYEGASVLGDVDAFLRDRGFRLHQLHTVSVQGREQQSSEVDALWVRSDVLGWLRDAHDVELAFQQGWKERMRRALAACAQKNQRVAIYGVGLHTRTVLDEIGGASCEIRGFIDDGRGVTSPVPGLPVVPASRAGELGVDAVILSSNSHEPALWENSRAIRDSGIEVVRLYARPLTLAGDGATGGAQTSAGASEPAPAAQVEPRYTYGPERFHQDFYTRLTQRRLEHLASLNLDLRGRVLELGAGVGDLTSFFADRGCDVTSTDARPELVSRIRGRFATFPNVRAAVLDLDAGAPGTPIRSPSADPFDVVVCYGLLYHLRDPERTMDLMADACRGMLLLETCVSTGPGEHLNPVDEDPSDVTQSVTGRGCRPTRGWVLSRLLSRFAHVYVPRTQPAHEEFPLDWSLSRPKDSLTRAVFVASCAPLRNPMLLAELPTLQLAA